MKRFTYAMVMAVALVVLVSSFAVAGPDCKTKVQASAEKVSMGECCIKAAKAGEGCCGKDADAVKAAFATYTAGCSAAEKAACTASAASAKAACSTAEKAACASSASAKAACATTCTEAEMAAYKAANADMHKCCATAVAASKGCCGKDADALKAGYEEKVAYHQAAATVTSDMHKCCATAMAAGKGCCGHSAEEMKADFEKKIEKEVKKVATSEKESSDS